MIVCICNNVNTAKIEDSILCGAQTLDAICEATGVASCCGKCIFKVNGILEAHTKNKKTMPPLYTEVSISA